MGSKGSNTKTTNSTQTYTPNPQVGAAGSQALTMATNAAGQPFQTPAAPVAPFSQDQLNAFQGVRDTQGMALPFYSQGADYMNRSAQPTTGAQIANYLNPYAGYALSGLNETLGVQNRDLQGNLVQAAGGVGSDRVAVGQAEKFRQDQMARGNLMASFYNPAMQAAIGDRSREANAGYGMGALGTGAQASALQGSQALLGTGGLQQQQQQAQLMSPYNQELQRIAWPYQNAEFLSNISAQQNPVMGGTTTGTQTTTGPKPSMLSQIAGAGMSAVGLMGGMGGFGGMGSMFGGGGKGSGSQMQMVYGGNGPYGVPTYMAAGGAVSPYDSYSGFADGGMPDSFNDRFGNIEQSPAASASPFPVFNESSFGLGSPVNWDDQANLGSEVNPMNFNASGGTGGTPFPQPRPDMEMPEEAMPTAGPMNISPRGGPSGNPYQMPESQLPYPESRERGVGDKLARSPWLALLQAGLATMAGDSPYAGVNIGKGGMEGIKVLEDQRKHSRSEETTNMAAQRMWQDMQKHVDRYTKLTKAEELNELKPFKIGMDPSTYQDVYGIRDTKTGEIKRIDPKTGKVATDISGAGKTATTEAPATPEDYLKTLPEDQQAYLKKIAAGEIAPPSSSALRSPRMAATLMQLSRAFPGFDATLWKSRNETRAAFAKGVEARSVGSLNTLMGHLQDFKETADKLSRHSLTPWNKLENAVKDRLGKSALADFKFTRTAVADEFARVFQGQGAAAEAEKQRWLDALDDAKSPEQFKAIIGRAASLLNSRMDSLAGQYNRGMGNSPEKAKKGIDFLEEDARKKYEGIGEWAKRKIPSESHIKSLRKMGKNIPPEAKAEFDEKYGPGSADEWLKQ